MDQRPLAGQPTADPSAIVERGPARFTLLFDRCIRCEYDPSHRFEDRASQEFIHRQTPVPAFSCAEDDGWLVITTDALRLRYRLGAPFTAATLQVTWAGGAWQAGQVDDGNLGGPARTVDNCDGTRHRIDRSRLHEHDGLLSRNGWALRDDSGSLVFDARGFLERREADPQARDWYLFAYGAAYADCLRDYLSLAGHPPLLPKWALGIWWSRWESYSQADLEGIVADFAAHALPLSCLVIDMDWHVVDNPHTNGWTGYSWNRSLFPDPDGLFVRLHAQDIHACLNLHPRDGVHPHEDAYAAMAAHMGIDAATQQPVPFAIGDPTFVDGYFRHLHHPLEDQGVDFWWIDWQQGTASEVDGLDPLWALNHYHSRDRARDGSKRPFTFSRWGGAGSHRYPIGFSGDSYRSWASLRLQTRFTAQCANLCYGWFSHDIGGFARGGHSDELYARWVQFGCFSPILRLHNCGDPTLDYRPWAHPGAAGAAATAALRFRRRLLPYLYTVNADHAAGGLPLLRPMHLLAADHEAALLHPYQYGFGPDLLVAPVSEPIDPATGCARVGVWLPPGDWHDFWTGEAVGGDRHRLRYCALDEMPVYARAGSLIPLADDEGLELVCFPGDGSGEIYDDAGDGDPGDDHLRWRVSQSCGDGQASWRIERLSGLRPDGRRLRLRLRGWPEQVAGARVDGHDQVIEDLSLADGATCTRALSASVAVAVDHRARFIAMMQRWQTDCHYVRPLIDQAAAIAADIGALAPYSCTLEPSQLRQVVETLHDCGCYQLRLPNGGDRIVWWNRSGQPYRVALSAQDECRWRAWSDDQAAVLLAPASSFSRWLLRVDCCGLGEWRLTSDALPEWMGHC